jgi:hypothetical protein
MVRAAPSKNKCRRLGAYVGLLALALQVFSDIDFTWNFSAPNMTPAMQTTGNELRKESFKYEETPSVFAGRQQRQGKFSSTTRQAAPELTIGAKIINAMGAGAVASVIQAALSAVGEPIVNRVLVKRMKIMEAINDVSAAQMLNFFKTTLTTNFLKFPFFEAINAAMAALPIAPSVRGVVTGLVFTSATLPVTNFRYRKSMDLPVNWSNIYEAYLPTVIRDIIYGIARNYFTIWTLALYPQWSVASPQVLFIVVIAGCLVSAPFNEWRGFLLQSKGQELTFGEFFKPSNFVRSTSLGALKQGIALAVGYWCAPPAQQFVKGLIASFKGV